MASSLLFGRGHGAFPLQFIDQLDDLGEKLDQPGSGATKASITLGHRLPLRSLSFWVARMRLLPFSGTDNTQLSCRWPSWQRQPAFPHFRRRL